MKGHHTSQCGFEGEGEGEKRNDEEVNDENKNDNVDKEEKR